MLELYDKVRVKSSGTTGTIIDISQISGRTSFIVESDRENDPSPNVTYHTLWPLYDCTADEIEKSE